MARSPKAPPPPLQTIDPTALATVAGGKARAPAASSEGGDSDVLGALNGIVESLRGLQGNSNQGFGMTEMMMFAMIMGGRNRAPATVVAANPPGYMINGVFYPFQ